MTKSSDLHLALEGQEGTGIRITSTTSLSYVRTHFPVPSAYIFGVPQRLEGKFKATDFLPLMLLRAEDCLQGKLGAGSTDYKAAADRLEYDVAQLQEALVRAKDEYTAKAAQQAGEKSVQSGHLSAARAQAQQAESEARTFAAEAKALREQKSQAEEAAKEQQLAAQRERHTLIAQLADASREGAQARAAAASAAKDVASFRAQMDAASGSAQDAAARRLALECVALARRAALTRRAHVLLRTEVQRALAEAARDVAAISLRLAAGVAFASALGARAAGAAKEAEALAAAARADADKARADKARLHAECDAARGEGDEARAEVHRLQEKLRADKAKQSADAKKREGAAAAEGSRLAAEMLATKEQLAAREREAKKARADADASRQVVRVQAEEALALAGQLQAVERLGAEHEEALARARAVADEARQAQDEVEAAWAEASGRRPVTFVEYIELRREVQQLALAGREFFVSPDSGRQQGVFLTRLARLETMLSGARHEGKALERTAGSAVALSDFTSKPLIARAVTQALHVDAAQPLHLPPGPANFGRRNSLPAPGSPSAGTVGSHLQTMQGLRSMHSLSSAGSQRRQGLPPSRPPSGRIR